MTSEPVTLLCPAFQDVLRQADGTFNNSNQQGQNREGSKTFQPRFRNVALFDMMKALKPSKPVPLAMQTNCFHFSLQSS